MRFTNKFDLIYERIFSGVCVRIILRIFERVRVCGNEKVSRVQGERNSFYLDCTRL